MKKTWEMQQEFRMISLNKQIISNFPNMCNYQGKQLCYNGEKYELSAKNAHLPMHELKRRQKPNGN